MKKWWNRRSLSGKLTIITVCMMLVVWLAAGGIMVHSTATEIYENIHNMAQIKARGMASIAGNGGVVFYNDETADQMLAYMQELYGPKETLPSQAQNDSSLANHFIGESRYAAVWTVDFYSMENNKPRKTYPAYRPHLSLQVILSGPPDPYVKREVVLDSLSFEDFSELSKLADQEASCSVTLIGKDTGYYFYPDTMIIDKKSYEVGLGDGQNATIHATAFEPGYSDISIQFERFGKLYYDLVLAADQPILDTSYRTPASLSDLQFTEAIYTSWNEAYGVDISATAHLVATPLRTALLEHLPDLGQLALLCAALGLVFFCVVRRLIVRPIRETADAAQAMTAEKLYGFPYDSTRGDEIGQLNSALHDMSYRLRGQWEAERNLERQRQEFLAAASHDLKTPLALIGGSAEAIAQEIDPDENARYLATIERECARMNGMIAQMLDASRTSQMKYLEKTAPFELPVLLDGLLLDRAVLFGARPVTKHIPPALSYCGDRAALGRAIGAILDNAAQYSAPDAKITVTLTDLYPGFRLTIENEGASILTGDLPHLFELFYRADHARDRKGSGIGLAVAARIFDLHGLKYRAENTENGVKFTVSTD